MSDAESSPLESLAIETWFALDDATNLVDAARAEAHMAGVLAKAHYDALVAQCVQQADEIEFLERDNARKEKVIGRLLAVIDQRSGRTSDREAVRKQYHLLTLVSEATPMAIVGPGHMAGPCPFCGAGQVHVWLGLHEFWCDGCYRCGDSVAFIDLLAERPT